ncbi:hypothetical protein A2696_00150 [Candidatus Curtissbacteria bacterium RIFCSPHIGHO2_01_FULL_41_13]|uniref:Uncharacterized protein n=2 Tax=Microgenomates group TaxID=1794810 RepID=A0A1F5FZS3_9BACT|nr:MAG: hypothetical protein A2696_00150 [Candidatus Curtissbacteria bacterium RIFCSPHIGHO2_01_FULL_41_13]OGK41583.1 MAG: hypothetical protein A3A74_08170 [Candidatus Roizmanbacteria bacterium RIFCSPLOWO2_01_FULL_35_13]
MNNERPLQVGDELSAIANVEELVKEGRVPIKIQSGEVGEFEQPVDERIIFYNIPPIGFTLGQNGCTGEIDPVECSVKYFDGEGKMLGQGELVGVRVEEAAKMDKQIAAAREQCGY